MKFPMMLCVAASLIVHGAAQEPLKREDPAELKARRAEHLRDMKRAQIAPLTNYLRVLDPLRQQFMREGKTDAALSVDVEIRNTKKELEAATAESNITTPVAAPFHIDSARIGNAEVNQWVDVTGYLQKAADSGDATVGISRNNMGIGDPAPYHAKFLEVVYTLNGKQKKKSFKAEGTLDFKKDLP